MRHLPFSLSDSFLAKQGYRRKKSRRRPQRTRRSLFEALEERAMLAGTAIEESLNDPAIIVTSGPIDDGPVFFYQPMYVLVSQTRGDGKASDQFVVRTEYVAEGKPRAVVSLRQGVTSIDDTLHTLKLELQLGKSVLERQEVLIDIESEAIRNQFLQDRLERVNQEIDTVYSSDVEDWVDALDTKGEFSDFKALNETEATKVTLDRLGGIAKSLGDSPEFALDTEARLNIYSALESQAKEIATAKLVAETDETKALAADTGHTLGRAALLLSERLVVDLATSDANVTSITPNVCRLFGCCVPALAEEPAVNAVTRFGNVVVGDTPLERYLIYCPDALGDKL